MGSSPAVAIALIGEYQRFAKAYVEDGAPDLSVRMALGAVREQAGARGFLGGGGDRVDRGLPAVLQGVC